MHSVGESKQRLPVFTCIEQCVSCHLEVSVDTPDFSASLSSAQPITSADSDSEFATLEESMTSDSASKSGLETPCENCLMTFENVDEFLQHLPCSKVINVSEMKPGSGKSRQNAKREKSDADAETAAATMAAAEVWPRASQSQSENQDLQCDICRKRFGSRQAMNAHKPCLGLKGEDGKYLCLECQVLLKVTSHKAETRKVLSKV